MMSSLVSRIRSRRTPETEEGRVTQSLAREAQSAQPEVELSEPRTGEPELEALARQQSVVAKLGQRALEGTWLASLMEEAVVQVGQTLGIDSCQVWERFGDGAAIQLRATAAWKQAPLGSSSVEISARLHAAYALQTDGPVVCEDLLHEQRFDGATIVKEGGLRSGMCVIIAGPQRPFGVLSVHAAEPRLFSRQDLDFLQAVANVLAAAIERKRAEGALRRSEENFRSIVEHIQDVLYRTDLRGVIQMISPSVSRYGYKVEDLLGRDVRIFFGDAEERDRTLANLIRELQEHSSANDFEFTLRTRDGRAAVVSANAHWLLDAQGGVIGVEGILRDITARKKAEQEIRELNTKLAERVAELEATQAQLIHSERMKALGVIAAGVAHEINNPIMGILNQIEYALSKLSDDGRVREVLWDALAHTRRCMRIVQDLLSYSRKDTGRGDARARGNLAVAVREALRSAQGVLEASDVHVSLRLDNTLPAVCLAESRMQQVVLNLILNARDAMSKANRRELSLETRDLGQELALYITDSGHGMDQETLARIFEPFYTTKPPGSGTGLGLSLCKNLVESVGGSIRAESAPGKGTTFIMRLPKADGQASSLAQGASTV
jgi:PAS domain S-box-containing protein